MNAMIAIVTALQEELAPILERARIDRVVSVGGRRAYVGTLYGAAVVLMASGDGLDAAESIVSTLLQTFDVSLLIGAGLAGAIVGALRPGDLVVARQIIATDGSVIECDSQLVDCIAAANGGVQRAVIRSVARIAGSVIVKKRLAAEVPAAHAIDTESAGWGLAAKKFGVKLIVVRAIFDGVDDEIPPFITAAGAAGPIDRAAVVRHALLHPRTIPAVLRMRSRMNAHAEAVAETIAAYIASLNEPAPGRLHELLIETSRTFALCIPLLPDSSRHQVTIAYLLFRIADTFEDASHWPVIDRLGALDDFCQLLRSVDDQTARRLSAAWQASRPSTHAGYAKLIADVPFVIGEFAALPDEVREVIRDHVIRSAQGMAKFVGMTDNGQLQLSDIEQLRAYCYSVAGIVGEMLTELFIICAPQLVDHAGFLRSRAAKFGEGLQLVNVLKDSADDAAEGRTYIPRGARREDLIRIARGDLESASEYTLALQGRGAPKGIVAFAALPVALAQATLDRIEKSGAGAKVPRTELFRITRQVNQLVASGEPPLPSRSHAPSALARIRALSSLTFRRS
jgi:farnesyl-diphosphate farnesyltransferase